MANVGGTGLILIGVTEDGAARTRPSAIHMTDADDKLSRPGERR